jgi:hypothetical protein
MKGEYENISKEVIVKAQVPVEVEHKTPEVTIEDMNILKRMIFEMKDFTTQTDNFVRQNLLTKLDLNNTAIEDTNQSIRTLSNKWNSFKGVTEKLEANIREQLDIIQSVNGKVNTTNDE